MVWALTGLFGALGVLHAVVTPIGMTPDEHTHADLIFHVAEDNPYPAHDGRITSQAAWNAIFGYHQSEVLPNVPEKRVELDLHLEQTFIELGGDVPSDNGSVNQMPQHPPLYYQAMAAAVRADRLLSGGASPWFHEWHRMRLVSFAPMLVLPILSWSSARRLGASEVAAVTAAAATLAVPQLLHITSGLNNDALLTVLGAVLAWLLAGVLAGRRGIGTAAAIGFVTGLALLTKAFAVVFPPWIALVYWTAARRQRTGARFPATRVGVAALVAVFTGGWWWVANLVRHGTPVPTIESVRYTEAMQRPGFEADPVWFLQRFGAWLPRRFVGWFGWFSVPLTFWVAVAVAGLLATATVAALARPLPGTSRRVLVAFGAVVPLLVAFVFLRAYDLYTTTGLTPFIQGRYLFAGFVPLAVLVGVGTARLLGRWAPLTMLVVAIGAQAEALRVMLGEFWGEIEGASIARSYESMVAWAPGHVRPSAVVAVAAMGAAVVLWQGARIAPGGWIGTLGGRLLAGRRRRSYR